MDLHCPEPTRVHETRLKFRMALDIPIGECAKILQDRRREEYSAPGLYMKTVKYRRGRASKAKETFRAQLLQYFTKHCDPTAEAQFMSLVNTLETDGCSIIAGLISESQFRSVLMAYEARMDAFAHQTFIHSYLNLAEHPDFILGGDYTEAFLHPLTIALIAYRMGGPIRIKDIRAKDTEPITIRAQDNVLHIDETPFRQEFKVLTCWRKGETLGPDGKNFVFLPGTHKGNRAVVTNEADVPESNERDSLFDSDAATEGLFAFQHHVAGRPPTVVEAQYPEKPLTIAFEAGSLVHHRYRNGCGHSRSCIITAFHLSEDDSGVLLPELESAETLTELLCGSNRNMSEPKFFSVLGMEALKITKMLSSLFNSESYPKLLHNHSLVMSQTALSLWRSTNREAPRVSSERLVRNLRLMKYSDEITESDLISTLTDVMAHDKHGLLQLPLYHDSREECRKPVRNGIRKMKKGEIYLQIASWLPVLTIAPLSRRKLLSAEELKAIGLGLVQLVETKSREMDDDGSTGRKIAVRAVTAVCQLLKDLSTSVVQRIELETHVATALFMFWCCNEFAQRLSGKAKHEAQDVGSRVLRCYISLVLVIENAERS